MSALTDVKHMLLFFPCVDIGTQEQDVMRVVCMVLFSETCSRAHENSPKVVGQNNQLVSINTASLQYWREHLLA